jgi:hypothetical protein
MTLEILPLAVTMMVGPQIMSAVLFVTSDEPVRVSLAFVLGVAVATTLGVAVARGIASLLGGSVSLGEQADSGSAGAVIQMALVALLALAAIKSYLGRETAEPPKWLGALMSARPAQALRTGLLVILLMPSDIVVMLTVGVNLEQNGNSVIDAAPFIAATVLVAALPLLAYLVFRRRAEAAIPKVREWMNSHSWVINSAASAIFIALILSG